MIEYKAISCNFVDLIEHFATRKEIVNIRFYDLDDQKEEEDVIIAWHNESSGEYLELKNYSDQIRLDRIISINEHFLADY